MRNVPYIFHAPRPPPRSLTGFKWKRKCLELLLHFISMAQNAGIRMQKYANGFTHRFDMHIKLYIISFKRIDWIPYFISRIAATQSQEMPFKIYYRRMVCIHFCCFIQKRNQILRVFFWLRTSHSIWIQKFQKQFWIKHEAILAGRRWRS